MDASTIITFLVGIAAIAGGFVGGRQTTKAQADAINAMRNTIDEQQRIIDTIPAMRARIELLESLVTQKANVELVIGIVTRIEEKLDDLTT
jgi:hypothetical protein